ncbi:MAG: 2-oxo acid dehydrogenase subunit E2 [Cellvibrionaceae bacterium]
MRYFKLPDLGEGLQDAEIVEWHINKGDTVKTDQLLVSVETAKAIVEVPSPQDGVIEKLFADEGECVHIGEPLVSFEGEGDESTSVVGEITGETQSLDDDDFIIGASKTETDNNSLKITPALRATAKKLGVDLNSLNTSERITEEDLLKATQKAPEGYEKLRGPRRAMAQTMAKVHREVVPVTLFEDADLHNWPQGSDITIRLCQAIAHACTVEPALNAWYHGTSESRQLHNYVDIGIAVDTEQGLFVPVMRDVANRSSENLREGLNKLRECVRKRSIPLEEMQGATITLSNFGSMAGRYATPVVVPPQVAIIGAGKIREEVVACEGKMEIHKVLPLSLTFDHRSITGGEASRFLAALIEHLK